VFEHAIEGAGEVAFEAAVCFAACLAFLMSTFDVGDRGGGVRLRLTWIMCRARLSLRRPERSRRSRTVLPEQAVSALRRRALRTRLRIRSGRGVGPGEEELRGGVGSEAGLIEQLRCELARDRFDLACELASSLNHLNGGRMGAGTCAERSMPLNGPPLTPRHQAPARRTASASDCISRPALGTCPGDSVRVFR